MLEWQRDWAERDTYDAVMDIVKTHYGAYGAVSSTRTPWSTARRQQSSSVRNTVGGCCT